MTTSVTLGRGAWPGDWTVLRDEANQRSTVTWKGKTAVSYPRGRFDHWEQLTYDIDDAHPDTVRVRRDSEYIQPVKDHVLTWRGRLERCTDVFLPVHTHPAARRRGHSHQDLG